MIAGTLLVSMVKGEGGVSLSEAFTESDAVFQKDMIRDWIYELNKYSDSFDIWGNKTKQEEA